MRVLLLLISAVALSVFSTAAWAWDYSPLGLAFDVGGGVKWVHANNGSLEFQNRPFVSGSLGKEFSARWYGDVTLERTAVQEAVYEIRAGVYYRVGRGSERY